MRIAPHLVTPLRFLLPFYGTSAFNRLKMRAGMWLYDGLSYDRSLPGHRMLSADAALATEPRLVREGLQGAASYSDAQAALPERLCIENIVDATQAGPLSAITRASSPLSSATAVSAAFASTI